MRTVRIHKQESINDEILVNLKTFSDISRPLERGHPD